MIRVLLPVLAMAAALTVPAGCSSWLGGSSPEAERAKLPKVYQWHENVLATTFWVGEKGNEASAWDPQWVRSFGGVDDPAKRDGFNPAGFAPKQSAFYCALPYNDVAGQPGQKSIYHARWVEVRANGRSCFCQWRDVGPWHTDDEKYVFGGARPKAEAEGKAGIDLSPAVRDYLKLGGKDPVDWRLTAPGEQPPAGPWVPVITDQKAGTYVSRRP